jgi:hypothetical protein
MALEFFRRRQKMVIIIMVVLMVAFLVPSGMSMLLRKDPMKQEMGQTRWGALTRGDCLSAQSDMEVLTSIGLGTNPYRYPPWPTEVAFYYLRARNGDRASLAYALLLLEARNAGVMVGDSDVKAFFDQIGLADPQRYREFISSLRASGRDLTEQLIRQAVRHWLMVNASTSEAQVGCPPSETEVAVTFRDMREQIDLRVLRLKADEFLKDVSEPNAPAIEEQFQKYRNVLPGQLRQPGQFSFGYEQPGRARIQYLLVRGDVIQRVTEPALNDMVDYWRQNKGEFVKKVPAGATTTGPATQATQPTKDVLMTFAEAKPLVNEKLREEVVRGRMDELIGQAETEARRLATIPESSGNPYAATVAAMTASADKALGTSLRGVKMENVSLEDAVARLADAAKLKGICFPWGTQGKQTLLPSVKVTLSAEESTLGKALEELAKQVKWPSLQWAMCSGFKGVLFSVKVGSDGIDFFPVQAADLPPKTSKELTEDPTLGTAYVDPAGRGMTLAESAFSAKELAPPGQKEVSMIQVGHEGGRMFVTGERPGRVIWRLVAATPAHVPASLTAETGLREQVATDLRLQAGFRKAVQEANKIAKASEAIGLEAIGAARKAQTTTTGLFARLRVNPNTMQMSLMDVPALGVTTAEMYQYVIPQAFALVPKGTETAPAKDTPGIGVLPVPMQMEVLVMERIGYRPPVKPEYDEFGRTITAQILMSQAQREVMVRWFTLPIIEKRTAYMARGGQD